MKIIHKKRKRVYELHLKLEHIKYLIDQYDNTHSSQMTEDEDDVEEEEEEEEGEVDDD
ncbi:unnamed protein product, partial [Didymodactylos carnosus]